MKRQINDEKEFLMCTYKKKRPRSESRTCTWFSIVSVNNMSMSLYHSKFTTRESAIKNVESVMKKQSSFSFRSSQPAGLQYVLELPYLSHFEAPRSGHLLIYDYPPDRHELVIC